MDFVVDISCFQTPVWPVMQAIVDGLGQRKECTVTLYCQTALAEQAVSALALPVETVLTELTAISAPDVFLSALDYPRSLEQYPKTLSVALLYGAERYCGEDSTPPPAQFRYWRQYDLCLCLNSMLMEPSALRLLDIEARRMVLLEGCGDTDYMPEKVRCCARDCNLTCLAKRIQQRDAQPLVSIITITWNLVEAGRSDAIQRCIQSVWGQTYPNIEHIIIDGASTDGTLELLAPFELDHMVQIFSEKDEGIYDAMNKGLARAKGEYILFLNSDDSFCASGAVEDLVTQIQKTDSYYGFADAEIVALDGTRAPWIGDVNLLPHTSSYCHQTLLMKTSLLREMGGFDTSYLIAADVDLRLRLFREGYPFCALHKKIVSYNQAGISSVREEQSHDEYMLSFYRHFGREAGITLAECQTLVKYRFLYCLPLAQQIELIEKLSPWFSVEATLTQMIQMALFSRSTVQQSGPEVAVTSCQPVKSSFKDQIKKYGRVKARVSRNGKWKVFFLFGHIPFFVKKLSQ